MANIKTVGELIDWLSTQPRDRLVVMASDAEGNNHSPLAAADEAMYDADSTWSGEVYCTPEELAENIAAGGGGWSLDDAPPDSAVRVVLLGPTN